MMRSEEEGDDNGKDWRKREATKHGLEEEGSDKARTGGRGD